jgi:hypothetical protein
VKKRPSEPFAMGWLLTTQPMRIDFCDVFWLNFGVTEGFRE